MQQLITVARYTFSVIAFIGVLALAVAAWLWLESSGEETADDASPAAPQADARRVELSELKLTAANLKTTAAETRPMAKSVTLLGQVDYDRNRFLSIKAFDDLVIEQLSVQVGQVVEADQTLLIVQCPALGKSRSQVLRQSTERDLLDQQVEREQAIHRGLQKMLQFVQQEVSVESIQDDLTDEQLGPYRKKIIEAYAAAILAEQLYEQAKDAVQQGAIAGRLLQERQAKWQSTRAELVSTCDESRFEVQQNLQRLQAQLVAKESELAIDLEYLTRLTSSKQIDIAALAKRPKDELGQWEIVAPGPGVVVTLPVATGARVAHEETLIELADPSHVWIKAWWRPSIGEVVEIKSGTPVTVFRPEVPDTARTANVLFTAAGFDKQTAALPIVARLDNSDRQFRPGQLVQVEVPLEATEPRLTIPASAVCEHEQQSFVFVPAGTGQFERRDIELAWTQGPWAVVERGIDPQTEVVSQNAFYLKSELLLEGEEE